MTIKKLPPLTDVREAILKNRDSVLKGVQFKIACEGMLLRSGESYEIATSASADAGQTAWVVGVDKRLVQIGQYNDKQWKLNLSTAERVPEGTLVFIIAPAK